MKLGELISGVDEAGRGSVIGPLIIVGLSVNKDMIEYFQHKGVKDSKLFTSSAARKLRSELALEIQHHAEEVRVIEVPSLEIDKAINNRPKDNLNLLELRYFSKLVHDLNSEEIILDTISSPKYSMSQITNFLRFKNELVSIKTIKADKNESKSILQTGETPKKVIISTKADSKYTVVAAASCVAKHIRDLKLREIEETWNLPELILGQGYPNEKDQRLMKFFQNYTKEIKHRTYPFIRYSWKWKYLQTILNKPREKLDKYF